jgi:hypothetical protein
VKDFTNLLIYARDELRGGFILDGYKPRPDLLERVRALLPRAHVAVVSGAWCGDCRREVPKLARILERLPAWTVELLGDEEETRRRYDVRNVPTFIIQHPETRRELGRIVESPRSGSLEADLLEIAEQHPTQVMA